MEQNQQIHDDLQDRLMDLALRRKFGTERACDLTEKIGSVESLRPVSLMSRTWFRLVIAASVLMAVGVAIGLREGGWDGFASMAIVDESDSMESRNDLATARATDWRDLFEARLEQDPEFAAQPSVNEQAYLDDVGYASGQSNIRARASRRGDINGDAAYAAGAKPKGGYGLSTGPAEFDPTPLRPGDYPYYTTRGPRDSFRENEGRYDRIAVVPGDTTNLYVWENMKSSRVSKGKGYIDGEDQGVSAGLRVDGRERGTVDLDGDGIADVEEGMASDVLSGVDPAALAGYSIDLEVQGRDRFARLNDNRFLAAIENPLSTFSIDVDTASYSVVRSRVENRINLPPEAVRVEELVNYFSYSYPQPTDGAPFAVHVDVAACPWAAKHRLVRIGLKGKEIAKSDRPASNLVFLVDVSGSMQPQNKLPLVKHGLLRLIGELDERDRVAIVVYAGNSGCVLASTPCTQANKERIRSAITSLESGGSTNGEAGIQLAYQIAQDHFVKGGANRVILCTDGDFNVGTTSDEALKQLVAERAKSGVFLTALGFGMGNHNDQMLEAIADNGNGTYGYIDDQREVEKLFVRDLSGTLVTIAKDVKIQVEFNPAQVGAYRLIGYENRILAKEDFNNDKKDAGDIGAGRTVTALYEIVPPAALAEASKANAAASEGLNGDATGKAPSGVDALEFQRPKQELELTEAAKNSGDMLLVKLRYKAPDGDTSTLIKTPAKDNGATFAAASSDFKFAASVAAFGMILRQSPFRGDITLAAVEEIAAANRGDDENNQRREFVSLVQQVRQLVGEAKRD